MLRARWWGGSRSLTPPLKAAFPVFAYAGSRYQVAGPTWRCAHRLSVWSQSGVRSRYRVGELLSRFAGGGVGAKRARCRPRSATTTPQPPPNQFRPV